MSIKILLADDSVTIQKVVGIIFGGEEYSLTVVDNGKAAVDKARELSPDVLLIDALMPGMSGYEVCEAIRATPALATKPILLLTGSFEPFDEDKAKTCGADDFLSKPFESQQIVAKVKELFEKGSTAAPAPAAEPEPVVAPAFAEAAEPAAAPAAEAPAADDIWGAFTAPEEPAAEPASAGDGTGSQWIPVEEETFEFQDNTAPAEEQTMAIAEPEADIAQSMFGDVEFEEPSAAPAVVAAPVEEPAVAAFEETVEFEVSEPEQAVAEPVAAVPVAAPVIEAPAAAASPVEMNEEQLRAAIMGASREVIERIVWEVVPDLAEVMIREAIEKIKRGE